MASASNRYKFPFLSLTIILLAARCSANDILGCGGFVKSHVKLDFSEIEIGLYTREGSLKEKTECAPTNGYYFLPLYEKGEYVIKVHPPAGLSFEPSEVALSVDGVSDECSTGQDINFSFNGFGINGRVVTLGQQAGPSGIAVQLISEKGESRSTETTAGGDFRFTAVIPGKYTVKASHPRWKLEPSQAEVHMKEGKMALPVGVVLTVKGYDVKGSVTSFGNPIEGVYVVLYSKEDNPKYRVEGCNTALLQGVPDSPICHVTTDASGEFTFGLVPAGEYKLVALSTTPGQVEVSYNLKPDAVPFTVRHDSLYIKNAFEVTGFTVVGSVVSAPGKGLAGARVLLDGTPVGTSDAAGKFTLAGLLPGVYTVSFQHETCELDDVQVVVRADGPRGPLAARAARWRVCGAVQPAAARRLALWPERAPASTRPVALGDAGKWCTFLPVGVYIVKVEVSEQEQREGLQYYPLTHKVSVAHGPVDDVDFSQLKGTLTGRVRCAAAACRRLTVALRPLAPGGRAGRARTAVVDDDGSYTFEDVLPGSVEVSVPTDRLCWAEASHNVAVTQAAATVPPFQHAGYVLRGHSTHAVTVEYKSATTSGELTVARGAWQACVAAAEVYTLTPLGCHKFEPPQVNVDTSARELPTVELVAVAHAVVVAVSSPDAVPDLVLTVDRDGAGARRAGPLAARAAGGAYVFTHTLYLADGEVAVVSASSSTLLFHPSAPQQLVGTSECQPEALTIRALRGLTLSGKIVPPVEDVTVTLSWEGGSLSQVTSSAGSYRFGPLDAARAYSVAALKESYVFSAPDDNGDMRAHKLAEIFVKLVDDEGKPLMGALVSVGGGLYRHTVSADGAARFTGLAPDEYYVRPHMKEYSFAPRHATVHVQEGREHAVTLTAVRVAWSCHGVLLSLGGLGWAGAAVAAVPRQGQACTVEDATTEPSGAFRIRGLSPECEYTLQLKESAAPELAGLRLARPPAAVSVAHKRDVSGVVLVGVQPARLSDGAALVRAAPQHYRGLRLRLAPARDAPAAPLYSAALDAAGYSDQHNPGLMYVLPRLPADNKSYVLQLQSSLSRATHTYEEQAVYFTADGSYRHFTFDFEPKVKSSEQELRQSSFLLVPLLGALAALYLSRARVLAAWPRPRPRATRPPARPPARADVLDKASIDHILNTVNAAGKKAPKKKAI